jgi:hypothetical protein
MIGYGPERARICPFLDTSDAIHRETHRTLRDSIDYDVFRLRDAPHCEIIKHVNEASPTLAADERDLLQSWLRDNRVKR